MCTQILLGNHLPQCDVAIEMKMYILMENRDIIS